VQARTLDASALQAHDYVYDTLPAVYQEQR